MCGDNMDTLPHTSSTQLLEDMKKWTYKDLEPMDDIRDSFTFAELYLGKFSEPSEKINQDRLDYAEYRRYQRQLNNNKE
jgi:hypothetical protein